MSKKSGILLLILIFKFLLGTCQCIYKYLPCKYDIDSLFKYTSFDSEGVPYFGSDKLDSSKLYKINNLLGKKVCRCEIPLIYYVFHSFEYRTNEHSIVLKGVEFNGETNKIRDSLLTFNIYPTNTVNFLDFDCYSRISDSTFKIWVKNFNTEISKEKLALKKSGFSDKEIKYIIGGRVYIGMREKAMLKSTQNENGVGIKIRRYGKDLIYYDYTDKIGFYSSITCYKGLVYDFTKRKEIIIENDNR